MRLVGPGFCCCFYYLMAKHTWVFLTIICPVLRKRLGVTFGLIWTVIGVVITYNVVWNHMLAMTLKPGSPKDVIVSRVPPQSGNCACVYRKMKKCVNIRRNAGIGNSMLRITAVPAVNHRVSRAEGMKAYRSRPKQC